MNHSWLISLIWKIHIFKPSIMMIMIKVSDSRITLHYIRSTCMFLLCFVQDNKYLFLSNNYNKLILHFHQYHVSNAWFLSYNHFWVGFNSSHSSKIKSNQIEWKLFYFLREIMIITFMTSFFAVKLMEGVCMYG